jgi:hypothetical protein
MATLGISTNTRLLGLAIIKQHRLLDHAIRLRKQSWSQLKAKEIITSLEPCVRRYCIKKVVLSIPYAHHQTKASRYLFSCIKTHFTKEGIPVTSVPAKAIYSFCREGEKKTKKNAMKALAEQFPILNYCLYKELRNKNRYYTKLFEAVAMAALDN